MDWVEKNIPELGISMIHKYDSWHKCTLHSIIQKYVTYFNIS